MILSLWTDEEEGSEHTLSKGSSSTSDIKPATVIILGILLFMFSNVGYSPEASSSRFE
jgi:hypothetical protein